MLSFSPVVRIGTPPPPYMQASVSSPRLPPGSGGAHSLGGEGMGEPNAYKGDRHCGTLGYISTTTLGTTLGTDLNQDLCHLITASI